jgi:hypothetical protein
MRGYNHEFRKNEIYLFFPEGLDRANQVERIGEIDFCARAGVVSQGRQYRSREIGNFSRQYPEKNPEQPR